MDSESNQHLYLTCERYFIFELLIMAAGMLGAYTLSLRGGVFCNAQTANVVLMAVAFGQGNFKQGLYYLIPISAYTSGALLSEFLPKKVRHIHFLRWDTYLIGFEMIVIFAIGWLPLSYPPQIAQVLINFICSMQYNTFRQAEGIPMATTFVTNHIRQFGIGIAEVLKKKDIKVFGRAVKHFRMILFFFGGGVIMAFVCTSMAARSIWLALLPMLAAFIFLVRADLLGEDIEQKPHGH